MKVQDVYTFEKGIVAERILHEALSMGANRAIKFSGVDIYDPLQANIISNQFLNYVRKQGNYDLILTGENEETDNILARIAYGLGYNYYDYVIKIVDESGSVIVSNTFGFVLPDYVKCMSASGAGDGNNVYWRAPDGSQSQLWDITRG